MASMLSGLYLSIDLLLGSLEAGVLVVRDGSGFRLLSFLRLKFPMTHSLSIT